MSDSAGIGLSSTAPSFEGVPLGVGGELPLLLIDDRTLERECLIYRLNVAGFAVVAASGGDAWLGHIDERSFALILYFCDGSVDRRKRALAEVAQRPDAPPVVVLSPADDFDGVVEAIGQGARGYISTQATVDHVIAAIRYVLAGGVFVPASSVLSSKKPQAEETQDASWQDNFTTKQVAVIEGIRRGKPNKVIAYELNMCESTVKVHVRNVMKKLKARNRTELAFKATKVAF